MKKNMTDIMVDYLNERYPEDSFDYKGPFGGGAGASSKMIIATSEKYPDAEVYVSCKYVNDEYIYADNYLAVKYENQTRNEIKRLLENCFGSDVYFNYKVSSLDFTEGSADMSFEQYISEPTSGLSFVAIIGAGYSNEDRKDTEQRIKNTFENSVMNFRATIYFDDISVDELNMQPENFGAYVFKEEYVSSCNIKNAYSRCNINWGE